jgi:hypothetical protein
MNTGNPKLISLQDWAHLTFGDKPPHVNTLRNWVNNGRIHPEPKKIGRAWFVKPDAQYRTD